MNSFGIDENHRRLYRIEHFEIAFDISSHGYKYSDFIRFDYADVFHSQK